MLLSTLKLIETYEFPCDHGHVFSPNPGLLLGPLELTPQDGLICSPSGFGLMMRNASLGTTTVGTMNSTIAALQQHFLELDLSGISIETWITPASLKSQNLQQPIVTIGQRSSNAAPSPNGCSGYDFCLSQNGPSLQLSYTDNDPAKSCRILPLAQEQLTSELTQVFVSVGPSETNVFINGNAVISGAPNNFAGGVESWDAAYGFQLFSNFANLQSNEAPVFTGSIERVSIYSGSISGSKFEQTLGIIQPRLERLMATPWFNSTAVESQVDDTVFWIGGLNASTSTLTVMVEVVSTPTHGSLLTANNTVVINGQLLNLGNTTRFPVRYRASPVDYFNVPAVTACGVPLTLEPENVTYRLVGTDPMDHHVLTVSDAVLQPIYVVHVNHRPTLLVPVQATAATDQPNGLGARPRYFVEGIQLLDTADQNIDRVRIDVWAFNGTLTLNTHFLHLANFESCLDRYFSSWQCFGTGDHNRNMTFLAQPSDVELILSNLQYDAFDIGQSDEIVIQAFDGVGGQCLDSSELTVFVDNYGMSFRTIQRGCYALQASVSVPAITRKAWTKMEHGNESMLTQVITSILLVTLSIFICCSASWCTRRCFRIKHSQKEPGTGT